jgi:predicted RNA-binding Zn ribbon-like protein
VIPETFQPAGRAPAPPPLDVVQDFVNTEIPEWARDDIASPEELSEWLRSRALLRPDELVDPAAFVAARALRATLRSLTLLNNVGGSVDASLRDAASRVFADIDLDIALDDNGRLVATSGGSGANRALASIVAIVMDAQASGTWSRLKACRKESCVWVFYDASRNGASTWCSMSICGNRVKTATYRRRRAGAS